jgi:hypothetical protein
MLTWAIILVVLAGAYLLYKIPLQPPKGGRD